MKKIFAALMLIIAMVWFGGVAEVQADTATWDVATVHGYNQFTISPDASTLLYDKQPRNTEGWYWYNNNGSPAGALATGGKQTPNGYRDGSRTFAMTNVAVGQKLSDLKLEFEYHNTLGGYPTINFFLTDGAGKFGIFAPTSSGIGAVAVIDVLNGWNKMTIDLTRSDISTTATMAVYEHNGLSAVYGDPYTGFQWADIKDLTIAGMYDYQRSPALGWAHWGTMLSPVNTAGNSTVVNGYGLALIWGDTVGNDTYTQQQREIRNVTVSFEGTEYTGTFRNAQVPEPTTLMLLGFGLIGVAVARRGRR